MAAAAGSMSMLMLINRLRLEAAAPDALQNHL